MLCKHHPTTNQFDYANMLPPFKNIFAQQQQNGEMNMKKKALIIYSTTMEKKHSKFSIKNCGFFILVQQPFLGTSPDSVINCDCCGNGCLEIKCPYIPSDIYISELLNSNNSCL
jgi:hypothetical protein